MKKFLILAIALSLAFGMMAQTQPAIKKFLQPSYMKGASVSVMVCDVKSGAILHEYDAERELIPASVMKLITTATALEILGENYRYETAIMYDGQLIGGTLNGNLYIRGGGDPSLGSKDLGADRDKAIRQWMEAIKKEGIRKITGAVIADEGIFDSEGISMKWLREDLGSYYGQGCYGLNIYDNRYTLHLETGEPDSKPFISGTDPDVSFINFRNYLTTKKLSTDSTYIIGFPYANERFLYGVVPANCTDYQLIGDIPEPALFLSQYMKKLLCNEDITIDGEATCLRLLAQEGKWEKPERKMIMTTYSRPLKNLVRIANHVSNNLYADAFLKTIGLNHRTTDVISSFGKGVLMLQKHWEGKGIKNSSLWMFDGSGLAPTDKVTAKLLCDILSYMATKSPYAKSFIESIPRVGMEGTVKNMLKGSRLQGNTRLKSGSMSRVRCYAGYVNKNGKQYAVAVLVNNFSCKQGQIKKDIEQLLLGLF